MSLSRFVYLNADFLDFLIKQSGAPPGPVAIMFGASTHLFLADDVDTTALNFYASTCIADGALGIVPASKAWKHYEILHTGAVEIF